MAAAVGTASSWSEMMKAIEHEKRSLSWQPEDVAPLVRVSMLDRKSKERELDPIIMAFRNQVQEQDHAAKRMQRTHNQPLQRIETIRKTQFNIVSHTGGPAPRIETVRKEIDDKREKTPSRQWHLLSHLPPRQHVECPTLYDEKYMDTNVTPKETSWVPGRGSQREFNIINNNFSSNHDDRLRQEYESTKQTMVKKYWDTHKFDIIRQEHYDDAAESGEREREFQASRVHGLAQAAKLPKSMRYSEGRSYDILNHEVKDDELIKISLMKGTLEHNRLTKYKDMQRQQVEAGKLEYDRWEQRHMQRVSYKRWEEQIERGYDFVHTNLLDPGYKPLPASAPKVWERLQAGDASRQGQGAGGPGGSRGGWGDSTLGSGTSSGLESSRGGGGEGVGRSGRALPVSAPAPAPVSSRGSVPVPESARVGTGLGSGSGSGRPVPSLDMRGVRTGGLSEYL